MKFYKVGEDTRYKEVAITFKEAKGHFSFEPELFENALHRLKENKCTTPILIGIPNGFYDHGVEVRCDSRNFIRIVPNRFTEQNKYDIIYL